MEEFLVFYKYKMIDEETEIEKYGQRKVIAEKGGTARRLLKQSLLDDFGIDPDKIEIIHMIPNHRRFLAKTNEVVRNRQTEEILNDIDYFFFKDYLRRKGNVKVMSKRQVRRYLHDPREYIVDYSIFVDYRLKKRVDHEESEETVIESGQYEIRSTYNVLAQDRREAEETVIIYLTADYQFEKDKIKINFIKEIDVNGE